MLTTFLSTENYKYRFVCLFYAYKNFAAFLWIGMLSNFYLKQKEHICKLTADSIRQKNEAPFYTILTI